MVPASRPEYVRMAAFNPAETPTGQPTAIPTGEPTMRISTPMAAPTEKPTSTDGTSVGVSSVSISKSSISSGVGIYLVVLIPVLVLSILAGALCLYLRRRAAASVENKTVAIRRLANTDGTGQIVPYEGDPITIGVGPRQYYFDEDTVSHVVD